MSLGPREITGLPLMKSGQDFRSTAVVLVDIGPPERERKLQFYTAASSDSQLSAGDGIRHFGSSTIR